MAVKPPSKVSQTRRKATSGRRPSGLSQQVTRQKKSLLALAGIGASGFTDISEEHDKYLHEKP